MHFILGGAYNGKANWVRTTYRLEQANQDCYAWYSAYENPELPVTTTAIKEQTVVIEGIEAWILYLIEERKVKDVRKIAGPIIQAWSRWSNLKGKQLIIIGNDLSKGIVPVDANLRKWRDETGFIYQEIVSHCKEVYYIWYGLAKRLK